MFLTPLPGPKARDSPHTRLVGAPPPGCEAHGGPFASAAQVGVPERLAMVNPLGFGDIHGPKPMNLQGLVTSMAANLVNL